MTKQKMKAVVYRKYGLPNVLQIEEIEKPTPKKNQILIKIYATTVTPSDILLRSGKFPLLFWLPTRLLYGFRNPRNLILGYELAGKVESVGSEVSRLKEGDEVFGGTYMKMSCNAEYICLPEDSSIIIKPSNLTYMEAAVVPDGASTALHFLRNGQIQSGQKVLIYGASGSVGTYAVQLAKYFGTEVTAVCSESNFELVRSLGADTLIDYTNEDYTKQEIKYDIIFDAVGRCSFSHAKKALKQKGIYLTTGFTIAAFIRGKWTSLRGGKKLKTGFAISNQEKMNFLRELIEMGKITPVIDRSYSLDKIADAHEYVSKGHKKGNVVISIKNNQE